MSTTRSCQRNFLLSCLLLFVVSHSILAQKLANACEFESKDSASIAKCLIRPVKRGASLGATPSVLPDPLQRIVGKPVDITPQKLSTYLKAKNINEVDVGGSLSKPLDRTKYFVIHDTSTPNFLDKDFPQDRKADGTTIQVINSAEWRFNNFDRWVQPNFAHVYVNRLGGSKTTKDFSVLTVQGTKYEGARLGKDYCSKKPETCETDWRKRVEERQGLFVHIELVQPRHCLRMVAGCKDDLVAPIPGFTDAQLDRLALLYVAASVRRGIWLMPAFHAAIDAGRRDGHDDPQNFDMVAWLSRLQNLLTGLESFR